MALLPPLSKKFIQSDSTKIDSLYLRSKEYFEQENIELIDGTNVISIDRHNKNIFLENGKNLNYDIVVLAMGADAKLPDFVSNKANNIHVLRDIQDALKLKSMALNSASAVIIGGGFIGLEVASSMRMAGLSVDIVEFAPRLLRRVSSPQVSDYFNLLHTKNGVSTHLGKAVEKLIYSDNGQVDSVMLNSGELIKCDLLIFGTGVVPNVKLAQDLGLSVSDGVTVDKSYSAGDGIYVIGDLAFAQQRTKTRVESVYHAQFSATLVAACITNSPLPKQEVFWFWSDQYDVKLQIAGILPNTHHSAPIYSEVRSGKNEGSFSVWSWFQNKFICVEAVRDPQSYIIGKRLLEQNIEISPHIIADETVPLKHIFENLTGEKS